MWTASEATAPFAPHSGTVVQPTAAPGYFAVRPPIATANIARTAAARPDRARRAVPGCASAEAPPSAPARTAVTATIARSVIATSQCATVAHGALPIFTVTPPRMAADTTATTAPSADRRGPPRPATLGSARRAKAAIAIDATVSVSSDARYRCETSTMRSGRLNGGNQ